MASRNKSAADFCSYMKMERDGEEFYLLRSRNLLNQFLVDIFAIIETESLSYIHHNQKKLKNEECVHLKDTMTRTDGLLSDLKKMVLLLSSSTGRPRYMHERTQDAIMYVHNFERLDLFVTFTCNPKWLEILVLLKQGPRSQYRYHIVVRVF